MEEAIATGFEWMSIIEWDRPDETGHQAVHTTYPVIIHLGFRPDPDQVRDQYDAVWNVVREDGIMTCHITADVEFLEPSAVRVTKIVRESFFYERF